MDSPFEPRIPDDYYPCIYIPVYSMDNGATWKALRPCVSSTEAKVVLKSWMPDAYRLQSDARFDGLRVGCVGIGLHNLPNKFSFEFVPSEFTKE